LGLGTTNAVIIQSMTAQTYTVTAGGGIVLQAVLTNAANFRTNIGLGWGGLTNTNASGFRSALELSAGWLTNTNVTNFRTAIGLGATNDVAFESLAVTSIREGTNLVWDVVNNTFESGTSFKEELVFVGTNASSARATTRTNLGLGATWLTNTNVTNFRTAIGLGSTSDVQFNNITAANSLYSQNLSGNGDTAPIAADDDGSLVYVGNSATYRSRIGLPLAALTNTSNVTIMRALAGSTNTNAPFSGSISVTGTNNTNTLVFTNGILREVTTP
jgi:hypothetical protein